MPVIVIQHQISHAQRRRRIGGCHQSSKRGKLVPKRFADEMVADQQGGIAGIFDLAGFGHPGWLRVHLLTEDTKTKGSCLHRNLLICLFVHLMIQASVKKAIRFLLLKFFLTSPSERFAVALAIFTITSRRMSFCRWSSCRSRQSRSYVGLAVLEKRKETVSGNAYHHPADGWIF